MNNTTLPTWPPVTVLIVTYDRPREIRLTLEALSSRLKYEGTLLWHIADDGSPNGYITNILDDFRSLSPSYTRTSRSGWGTNVNKALSSIQTNYTFLNEDDYVPRYDMDLTSGVALLEVEDSLGIIRYDGIEGHILDLHLRESNTRAGRLNYLRISKLSPHLNVYSHRPHLRHRRLHDTLGLYAEGLALGVTEEEFAHRVKDVNKPPHVAILPSGIPCAFSHEGHSRQGTSADTLF